MAAVPRCTKISFHFSGPQGSARRMTFTLSKAASAASRHGEKYRRARPHRIAALRAQLAARGGRLAARIGLYPGCGSPEGNSVIVPLLALSEPQVRGYRIKLSLPWGAGFRGQAPRIALG